MTTTIQTSVAQQANPLFEKMCDRFQFEGHITVADMALKRASHHTRLPSKTPRTASPKKQSHRIAIPFKSLQKVAFCSALIVLSSILLLCAVLSYAPNGKLSKVAGIFSGEDEPVVTSPSNPGEDQTIVYEDETRPSITVYSPNRVFEAFQNAWDTDGKNQ